MATTNLPENHLFVFCNNIYIDLEAWKYRVRVDHVKGDSVDSGLIVMFTCVTIDFVKFQKVFF